ncbi:hypothetical protein [Nocardia sp. BMG51109]|uniref:hypothetical protein n=1 Tax=Nocardia sp. BMG51109 TaxID=1056816 RepID=UPI000467B8E0|nr:hypothetical protein [Nocardia sp. BMG51109]
MSATIRTPAPVAEQYRDLIAEFQALIAKYPDAEGKFVLAHLPEGTRAQRPGTVDEPIVWECETTSYGLDCRPVILQA